jgi:putative N6-adenine-specific DNA methylase
MDSTGPGLHKRGYRSAAGEAALKETLAAGLVYLSRWKPGIALADPFCGSGTIAIEAAMMGRNIAPGTGRQFAAEQWPFIPSRVWDDARREAGDAVNRERLHIFASDIDEDVIVKARRNARHAGFFPPSLSGNAISGVLYPRPGWDGHLQPALWRTVGGQENRRRTGR